MLKRISRIFLALFWFSLASGACISRQGAEATATIPPPVSQETQTEVVLAPTAPLAVVTSLPSIIPSLSPIVSSPTTTQTAPGLPGTPEMPEGTPSGELSTLPITFPIMSPEMADYFNRIARPDDIALIPPGNLHLLPEITSGQVRVGFASWAEAERELPGIAGKVDVVAYNPEHWEQTPAAEKENLPLTIQAAAQFAHNQGVKLMVTPDLKFASEYLDEIAPHADMIGLQGQRLQNDPQTFEVRIREMIQIIRASNPDVQIFVQVGATQGTASEMLAALQTLSNEIDGISIWTNLRTFAIFQEFVSEIRPGS